MNDERAREFVSRATWTFAKTMASFAPHEYVVRGELGDPELEGWFEDFVRRIRANGYRAKWHHRRSPAR